MEGRVKSKKEYDYTVPFEPAVEGGYVVTCPALPGLVTEGDTLEEAQRRPLLGLLPGNSLINHSQKTLFESPMLRM